MKFRAKDIDVASELMSKFENDGIEMKSFKNLENGSYDVEFYDTGEKTKDYLIAELRPRLNHRERMIYILAVLIASCDKSRDVAG